MRRNKVRTEKSNWKYKKQSFWCDTIIDKRVKYGENKLVLEELGNEKILEHNLL